MNRTLPRVCVLALAGVAAEGVHTLATVEMPPRGSSRSRRW